MTFERTFDYELVARIVTDPQIYRASVLSDFAPPAERYSVGADMDMWCVLPLTDERRALGVFIFDRNSPTWYEVHMCLLPAAWGKSSAALCLACAHWFADQSGCRCITATVPAYNRTTHALARRIGMRRVGVLERSIMQRGKLHDQTIYSLAV